MKKIIFVCTGNVFRSMSAEYLFRKYAEENNLDLEISSAGTLGENEVDPVVAESLKEHGIDVSKHKSKKISSEMIQANDLIIAMAKEHQDYIKEHFGIEAPLFNEIAFGKKTSVQDNCDVLEEEKRGSNDWGDYNKSMVDYLSNSIESFAQNYNDF